MSKKSQKGPLVLKVVAFGLLNLLIDVYFLPHSAGWLVFDIIFWAVVIVSVTIGRALNGSKSTHETPLSPSEIIKLSGPFWNKPSVAFLQNNAQPLSEANRRVALTLLLLPFVVLIGAILYLR